jgi:hypothetical protein
MTTRESGRLRGLGRNKAFLAESVAPKEKEAPAVKNDYVLAKERKSAVTRAKAALKKAEERVQRRRRDAQNAGGKAGDQKIASDYEAAKAAYEEMDVQRQLVESSYLEWEQAEAELRALLEEEDD